MSRKLEFMLRAWGDYHIKHGEHADEYGENILYAAGVLQGRVQDASHSQSKILCAEMPPTVRRVGIHVDRLPQAQMRAIVAWYCAPLREDGTPYTQGQIATRLRMTLPVFQKMTRLGKNTLSNKLL